MSTRNFKNLRLATEIPQPGCCERQFDNEGNEVVVLYDSWECNTPVGKISISGSGIEIELDADRDDLPVTITRKTVRAV